MGYCAKGMCEEVYYIYTQITVLGVLGHWKILGMVNAAFVGCLWLNTDNIYDSAGAVYANMVSSKEVGSFLTVEKFYIYKKIYVIFKNHNIVANMFI